MNEKQAASMVRDGLYFDRAGSSWHVDRWVPAGGPAGAWQFHPRVARWMHAVWPCGKFARPHAHDTQDNVTARCLSIGHSVAANPAGRAGH